MLCVVGDGTETQKQRVLDALAQLGRRPTARQARQMCFLLQRTSDREGSSVQTLWPYARSKGSECDLSFPQAGKNVCDQRSPTTSKVGTLRQQNEMVRARLQAQATWL